VIFNNYDDTGTATYTPSISASIVYPTDCSTTNSIYVKKWIDISTNASIYHAKGKCTGATTPCSYCDFWLGEDSTGSISKKYILKASYTWANDYNNYHNWSVVPAVPVSPSQRLRQILQSRQAPSIITSRTPVRAAAEGREIRARQTLRRMLGDDGFQRFLRNGFVSVQAHSGKVYQIYPGHGMTIVYLNGKPIEKLCVVLEGNFTPTDHLITRYVMILHDEDHFRASANVFAAPLRRTAAIRQLDTRSLPQIFHDIKAAA
jgi:hypothetical protein